MHDDVLDHRQPVPAAEPLRHFLVHRSRGRQNPGADIRQVREFEQSLHGAVFAEGAVQHREHNIDTGIAAGFRQDRPRLPLAFLGR